MGKASKATKKFQSKHLKNALDKRRVDQVAKQRALKGRRPNSGGEKVEKAAPSFFDDMSVSDFMKGGFEVPEEKKGAKKARQAEEAEEAEEDDEEEEEDGEEVEDDSEGEAFSDEDAPEMEDPEFLKYLNDDEGAGAEDAEDAEEKDKEEVTMAMVKKWAAAMEKKHSVDAAKNALQAAKAALASSEDENATSQFKYVINDGDVVAKLMDTVNRLLPKVLTHHCPLKTSNKGAFVVDDEKAANNKNLSVLVKSYGAVLLESLTTTSGGDETIRAVAALKKVMPYMLSHRKLVKNLISAVAQVWGTSNSIGAREAAFALMITESKEHNSTYELILKAAYTQFVASCRNTSFHTMGTINFMKNTAAMLYAVNEQQAYPIAFDAIRQLAIHLRTSLTNKTSSKQAHKAVYNWQYVHSLDYWSRVISDTCDAEAEAVKGAVSPLRPLLYPLVQVTLGTIRLIPSTQFFPLRFYLIRSLLRISQRTGVYIPLLPLLTELLNSSVMTRPPKSSALKPLDFDYTIRGNKSYLGTRVYQEGVCDQIVELTAEFFVLYCKSVAFPELAIPAVITFKRFTKRSRISKFNRQILTLLDKIEANSKFIEQKRSNIDFGPTNRDQVNNFLKDTDWQKTPLGSYVVVQRQVRAEKLTILRESQEMDNANGGADGYESDDINLADLKDDADEDDDDEDDDDEDEDME